MNKGLEAKGILGHLGNQKVCNSKEFKISISIKDAHAKRHVQEKL